MRALARMRGPSSRDLSRLVLARASARLAVDQARLAWSAAVDAAYRAEAAATVTRASAFLSAVLANAGLTPSELLPSFAPPTGWPASPRVPASTPIRGSKVHARTGRRAVGRAEPLPWPDVRLLGGVDLSVGSMGRLRVHVVDHSIEVAGSWGELTFATLFGMLRVDIPPGMPPSSLVGYVGRPLSEVMPDDVLRGGVWPIVDVVRGDGRRGWALLCRTGSERCRLSPDGDVGTAEPPP